MDDSFFTERARQVREIATKADPFTKKRLLELANRYERNTTRRVTPLPTIAVQDHADDQQSGADTGYRP
jgi:hypothetical protein